MLSTHSHTLNTILNMVLNMVLSMFLTIIIHLWRSLHSPWFSGRTPGGLHRTRPIQNSEFSALEWLELSGDSPVIVRCMLVGLLSPTDFSGRQSDGLFRQTVRQTFPADSPPEYHQTSRHFHRKSPDNSRKSDRVQRKVQRTAAESPTESNGQQADQLTYYYYY